MNNINAKIKIWRYIIIFYFEFFIILIIDFVLILIIINNIYDIILAFLKN